MDFSDAVVSGVPLLLLVAGLVEFAKKAGLAGIWLTSLSLVLGLAFGVAFQLAEGGVPADFAGWLSVAVYGLGLGVVTSGLYDLGKRYASK